MSGKLRSDESLYSQITASASLGSVSIYVFVHPVCVCSEQLMFIFLRKCVCVLSNELILLM